MLPLLGGLLTGGASLLGSIFSSSTSASNTQAQIAAQQAAQRDSELFNRQEAETNRGFQASQLGIQREYETQMSNTAYQRASQDMKSAGLNPMMMFGSGSAASTPSVGSASGSTASVGTPSVPMPQNTHPLAGLGQAVAQGIQSTISAKTIEKMGEEISNLRADRAVTEAREPQVRQDTATSEALEKLRRQEKLTEEEETRYRMNTAAASALRLAKERFENREYESRGKMPDWLIDSATWGSYLGRSINDTISPITNSARSAKTFQELWKDRGPRRSTIERSDNSGRSSFEERFHY